MPSPPVDVLKAAWVELNKSLGLMRGRFKLRCAWQTDEETAEEDEAAEQKSKYRVSGRNNYLGEIDSANESAQAYPQHLEEPIEKHQADELAAANREGGTKRNHQLTSVPGERGVFGMQGVVMHNQASAGYSSSQRSAKLKKIPPIPPSPLIQAALYLDNLNSASPSVTEHNDKQAWMSRGIDIIANESHSCVNDPKQEWSRKFSSVDEQGHRHHQRPCVGACISVHWPEEGQWFSGRVSDVSDEYSTYCVVYDDGDTRWHSWKDEGCPDWRLHAGDAVQVHAGKMTPLLGCGAEEQQRAPDVVWKSSSEPLMEEQQHALTQRNEPGAILIEMEAENVPGGASYGH